MMKPEPAPCISRWRIWSRNWRCSAGGRAASGSSLGCTGSVTAMLTTAGSTRRTIGAKLSGPVRALAGTVVQAASGEASRMARTTIRRGRAFMAGLSRERGLHGGRPLMPDHHARNGRATQRVQDFIALRRRHPQARGVSVGSVGPAGARIRPAHRQDPGQGRRRACFTAAPALRRSRSRRPACRTRSRRAPSRRSRSQDWKTWCMLWLMKMPVTSCAFSPRTKPITLWSP